LLRYIISNEDIAVNKDFVLLAKWTFRRNRPVNRVDQRIQKQRKLGFSTILYQIQQNCVKKNTGIKKLIGCQN
jgi:predicted ATP-dependent serine protease